ncbi:MAG: DNA polymerase III subunit alpha [Chloroflexi bacterium]|nr:MAG: DNA polymerase III subunit alpha [Chloroflexota bacterium]
MMPPYAELHAHSNFSFLEGASHVDELVLRALELGYETLALTDHDGLHGAMEFAQCAQAWGLRPITGAEITLARSQESGARSKEGEHHLTLLCETARGYANLCRLLTHAHLDHERGKPCVELAVLAQHAEGLIALSGCRRGEVPLLIAEGRPREAEEAARRYAKWFGPENFFIELQNNLVYRDVWRNRVLGELAEHLKVGVVATGNVHYHTRERHRLQDALVAIKNRTTLDASHQLRRENSEYFLKSPAEMAELFSDHPQAIANTQRIAERCGFDLTRDLEYRFPDTPVPEGETAESYLRAVCRQEAARRYPRFTQQIEERLEQELRLVEKHGLSGFFRIHREILQLAHAVAEDVRGRPSHGPPGRGRGSSVGSVICYLIGLSHIDPIANNLFLGRFLNDEMASVPDIDLDFPRDIREKLILRTYEYFGHDNVGLVATFPTYRIRGAIREVGKALGLPPAELDRLAKVSEGGSAKDIRTEMGRLEHYRERLNAPLWRHLAELSEQIAGFPRHISQHVGGMVISSRPLIELVPLEQSAMEGRVLMQWDKDSVDDARMIKIDFLALGMLSAVDETLELIEEHRGTRVDLSRIDFKDKHVYDSICEADTMGVFQIESRAQMQTLPRVRPQNLEDLTVQVAIIRPGPIVGGSVNPYINRRMKREEVTYDHPSLEPVLAETLGVILYQEQVLQVAMALAGFSAGQAESLRRAMSRKRSREAIGKLKDEFIAGALAQGVSKTVAEQVFHRIDGFAEFGFPKAHAAAFGLLAYQTAWLRTYFPAESLCALFNAQPMGFYAPHVLVNDGKRHGVQVLPPDINSSGANCTIEEFEQSANGNRQKDQSNPDFRFPISDLSAGLAVRIGLRYVRGLSEKKGAKEIEEERKRGSPFRSLFDFIERTRVKREVIENLIACGAFDCFGLERRELIWQLGLVYRSQGRNTEQRQLALALPVEQDMVQLRPMSDWDKMRADYIILGMSPNVHPMSFLRPRLHEGIASTAMVESFEDGKPIEVAGLVVCRQRPETASGFIFMVIEDEFGLVNVVIKPDVYEAHRTLVRSEPFVIIRGELQRRDGVINLIAQSFVPLTAGGLSPAAHNFGTGHGGRH